MNKIGILSLQLTDHVAKRTYSWSVGGTLSFVASGEVGEIVPSANRAVAGVKVTQMPGKLDIEGIDSGVLPLSVLQGMRDATAVASLANGTTKTCTGSVTGQPELDVLEGKISFVIEGDTSEVAAA